MRDGSKSGGTRCLTIPCLLGATATASVTIVERPGAGAGHYVGNQKPLMPSPMIPMGGAHLRMTVLPVISDRADARYWQDIPNADEFMLDRLDQ